MGEAGECQVPFQGAQPAVGMADVCLCEEKRFQENTIADAQSVLSHCDFEYNMQFSMSFRLCFHSPEISTG